jgi:16S rRNA (cytosine967-C5)-methyltransferase
MERLYAEIAEVKEPFDRDNLWKCLLYGRFEAINSDWRQLEGTPERKIKDALMNYQSKSFKESIPDWMDELGVKELGEKVWATEITAQNQPAK